MDLDAIEEDSFAATEPQNETAETASVPSLRPSILIAVSDLIAAFDAKYSQPLSSSTLHLYAGVPPDTIVLESIIQASGTILNALASHIPSQDPKYEGRTKEYTKHTDHLLQASMRVGDMSTCLSNAKRMYDADPPLEMGLLPDWIVAEITRYLKSAGATDVYKETTASGTTTLTCGGKILVIDIELKVRDPIEPLQNHNAPVQLFSIKTSHTSSTSQNDDSIKEENKSLASLDALLFSSLDAFISKAHHPSPDCRLIRHLGRIFERHIRHLLSIDALAHNESSSGASRNEWFGGLDQSFRIASELLHREVSVIASTSGTRLASLDVFLVRGHGFPLPNLVSPSLSFLVHLSPHAYLGLLRSTTSISSGTSTPLLDVHTDTLRRYILQQSLTDTTPVGYTLVTLAIDPTGGSYTKPNLIGEQPTFNLLLGENSTDDVQTYVSPEHLNHTFGFSTVGAEDGAAKATISGASYYVDLGEICMRREAMGRIALGASLDMHDGDPFGIMQPLSTYTSRSWVDLITSSKGSDSNAQYVSEFSSPSSSHPRLLHRLASAAGPGYILGRVPVERVSDVWKVIEIVKEQAWLNEIVRSFSWTTGTNATAPERDKDSRPGISDDEELAALLQGSFTPRTIPVQVELRSVCPNPSVSYTMPTPTGDVIVFIVTFDPGSSLGIRVDILNRSSDKHDVLEHLKPGIAEVFRRGGAGIVAGWVWKKLSSI